VPGCKGEVNLQGQYRINLAAQNVRQRDWLPSNPGQVSKVGSLSIGDEQREFLVEAVLDM
jgi:hypothetical protein